MQRASKLSLLHTDWVICVYDDTQIPYYIISSTLPDLNNKPNNFVCCFYEHGVNLIELTYFSRYDKLINDFCSYIDKATQLHLKSGFLFNFSDCMATVKANQTILIMIITNFTAKFVLILNSP